jgi:hypothetical protein
VSYDYCRVVNEVGAAGAADSLQNCLYLEFDSPLSLGTFRKPLGRRQRNQLISILSNGLNATENWPCGEAM